MDALLFLVSLLFCTSAASSPTPRSYSRSSHGASSSAGGSVEGQAGMEEGFSHDQVVMVDYYLGPKERGREGKHE